MSDTNMGLTKSGHQSGFWNGKRALVTGAAGGLGTAFVHGLIERGIGEVFATDLHAPAFQNPRVRNAIMDISDPESVTRVAADIPELDVLINNGGCYGQGALLEDVDLMRTLLETHLFGTLTTSQRFAPALSKSRGSMLNVLSVLSWLTRPGFGAYAVAKSAEWALTNGLRLELSSSEVRVIGLHVAFVDTAMTRGLAVPKLAPKYVVSAGLDGIERGVAEVVVDERSAAVRGELSRGVSALYPELASLYDFSDHSAGAKVVLLSPSSPPASS